METKHYSTDRTKEPIWWYSKTEYVVVVCLIGLFLLAVPGLSWADWLCRSACLAYLLHYMVIREYGIAGKRWSIILRYVISLVFIVGAFKVFPAKILGWFQ